MKEITPFDFEGRAPRAIHDAQGVPWVGGARRLRCLCRFILGSTKNAAKRFKRRVTRGGRGVAARLHSHVGVANIVGV